MERIGGFQGISPTENVLKSHAATNIKNIIFGKIGGELVVKFNISLVLTFHVPNTPPAIYYYRSEDTLAQRYFDLRQFFHKWIQGQHSYNAFSSTISPRP